MTGEGVRTDRTGAVGSTGNGGKGRFCLGGAANDSGYKKKGKLSGGTTGSLLTEGPYPGSEEERFRANSVRPDPKRKRKVLRFSRSGSVEIGGCSASEGVIVDNSEDTVETSVGVGIVSSVDSSVLSGTDVLLVESSRVTDLTEFRVVLRPVRPLGDAIWTAETVLWCPASGAPRTDFPKDAEQLPVAFPGAGGTLPSIPFPFLSPVEPDGASLGGTILSARRTGGSRGRSFSQWEKILLFQQKKPPRGGLQMKVCE